MTKSPLARDNLPECQLGIFSNMSGQHAFLLAHHRRAVWGLKSLIALACLLSLAPTLLAQISAPGWSPPPGRKTAEAARERSIAEKAAGGEVPLSRKYSHLKLETSRPHRLPAPDRCPTFTPIYTPSVPPRAIKSPST